MFNTNELDKKWVEGIAELKALVEEGKANLESRVVEDELWWELRHWESLRRNRQVSTKGAGPSPEPTSAWLFNAILNCYAAKF